ncbi:hypothetical protein [Metabacillus sp. 84]|uniref:hypothetical protein n=1 Tax=unclassified Metabacillus TaxID=2675274 RepID=UPI003CE9A372
MKTITVLTAVIIIMHTMTLINVTIFDGQLNGFVIMFSNVLFFIGVAAYSREFIANRKRH